MENSEKVGRNVLGVTFQISTRGMYRNADNQLAEAKGGIGIISQGKYISIPAVSVKAFMNLLQNDKEMKAAFEKQAAIEAKEFTAQLAM